MISAAPFPFTTVLDASPFAALLLPALLFGLASLYLLWRHALRPLSSSLPSLRRAWWVKLLEGCGWGAALLAVNVLAVALTAGDRSSAGWRAFAYGSPGAGLGLVLTLAGFFLLQSLTEELNFRALLLSLVALVLLWIGGLLARPKTSALRDPQALLRGRLRLWLVAGLLADAFQAVLFARLHAANPHVTPLAILNIGLAGAVLGWVFWSGGGLWGAWGLHFVWNFGLALFGLPVSGIAIAPSALGVGLGGLRPSPVNGGLFGPEGSLVDTLTLVVLLAFLVARDVRRIRSTLTASSSDARGDPLEPASRPGAAPDPVSFRP